MKNLKLWNWQLISFFFVCVALNVILIWFTSLIVQHLVNPPEVPPSLYNYSDIYSAVSTTFYGTPVGFLALIFGLGGLNALRINFFEFKYIHKIVYILSIVLGLPWFLSSTLMLFFPTLLY